MGDDSTRDIIDTAEALVKKGKVKKRGGDDTATRLQAEAGELLRDAKREKRKDGVGEDTRQLIADSKRLLDSRDANTQGRGGAIAIAIAVVLALLAAGAAAAYLYLGSG